MLSIVTVSLYTIVMVINLINLFKRNKKCNFKPKVWKILDIIDSVALVILIVNILIGCIYSVSICTIENTINKYFNEIGNEGIVDNILNLAHSDTLYIWLIVNATFLPISNVLGLSISDKNSLNLIMILSVMMLVSALYVSVKAENQEADYIINNNRK